jgi:predicted component of type VI protein secretion system
MKKTILALAFALAAPLAFAVQSFPSLAAARAAEAQRGAPFVGIQRINDAEWRAYETTAEVPAAPGATVPGEVTAVQARLALIRIGKLDAVDAAIAAFPSPQKEIAQQTWMLSPTVQRNHPFVLQLGQQLGLDLDALFTLAASITP